MRLLRLFPALLLALALLPAQADDNPNTPHNQVSLSSDASREVEHDLMRVSFYSQEEGKVPAELAKITTERMNSAIAKAREVKAVSIQSGNRSTVPVYDKDGKTLLKWRETAELYLESKDMTALATLSGELLEDLKMTLSREKRKEYEDSLTREAIEAFRMRARLITEALGGKSWRLLSLGITDAGSVRPYNMRSLYAPMEDGALMSSAQSQQIEAGSSALSVRVDGLIEVND